MLAFWLLLFAGGHAGAEPSHARDITCSGVREEDGRRVTLVMQKGQLLVAIGAPAAAEPTAKLVSAATDGTGKSARTTYAYDDGEAFSYHDVYGRIEQPRWEPPGKYRELNCHLNYQ